MLGWILLGMAAVAVGVIVISGIVDKSSIKEQMEERDIEDLLITKINTCNNTVKLRDLWSDETIEIQGDYIA